VIRKELRNHFFPNEEGGNLEKEMIENAKVNKNVIRDLKAPK
jgi:hypothetical protein